MVSTLDAHKNCRLLLGSFGIIPKCEQFDFWPLAAFNTLPAVAATLSLIACVPSASMTEVHEDRNSGTEIDVCENSDVRQSITIQVGNRPFPVEGARARG